jgi:glycosyltransferase involved in cell wall biosynthesis
MSRTAVRRPPKVAVLYHYFYPDDVVSARHLTHFCLDLKERGWQVEALPCNRGCRDESITHPLQESWEGLTIQRVWRPRFRQASTLGRLGNAAWMVAAWCTLAFRPKATVPDVIVIGTDPVFSVVAALVIRVVRPRIQLAHWAFDLHPECSIAEGKIAENSWLARIVRGVMRRAYHSCDLVADLGACMRRQLDHYGHRSKKVTLVPWALVEPDVIELPDQAVRTELFGDATLGLLYSGNFGRAHSYAEIIELARRLRGAGVAFCFGIRGNCADEVRTAVQPDDSNVRLAGFAPEEHLSRRLAAADIHLVSLRPEWAGLVVPSKFFGALAAGRPILFAGPRDAGIAQWIEEHRVGWVLDQGSLDQVAAELRQLASEPQRLKQLQEHCLHVYQSKFSRRHVMDLWHSELTALLDARSSIIADASSNTALSNRSKSDSALPINPSHSPSNPLSANLSKRQTNGSSPIESSAAFEQHLSH